MSYAPLLQVDIVQMLLVYGADATLRNKQGALPYHLASLPELRNIIKVRPTLLVETAPIHTLILRILSSASM